ncbi:MAG TPA: hypothetical protein VER17_12375 [Tepidisphaeraceae bacterium]|nr:hypothetical protein [Tepidisphaeraceae bacterium]
MSFFLPLPALADAYVPFVYPLPLWEYWPWLILPLCAGVAIVYKSVKCQTMARVPREALVIFAWMLVGFAAAAGALAGVVRLVVER